MSSFKKISPLSGSLDERSPVARFSKLLVTLHAIPVPHNAEFTSAQFTFLSLRTFVCLIICYGLHCGSFLSYLFYADFFKDFVNSFFEKCTPFDLATSMLFFWDAFVRFPSNVTISKRLFCRMYRV